MKQDNNDIRIICEFDFCIYNKNNKCILSCISISATGLCNDCLLPNIDSDTLEKHKQETHIRLMIKN